MRHLTSRTLLLLGVGAFATGAGLLSRGHATHAGGDARVSGMPSEPTASPVSPVLFERNEGQFDARVQFQAQTKEGTLFFSDREVVIAHREDATHTVAVRMQLLAGSDHPAVNAEEEAATKVHRYSSDPGKSHASLATYKRLRYRSVYPGIDVAYYGSDRSLEYDFVVAPGADPSKIRLGFEGADRVSNDGEDLVVHVGTSSLRLRTPHAYEDSATGRRDVSAHFVADGNEAKLALGEFDRSNKLVIDPIITWATYLGGPGSDSENSETMAVDNDGNAYVKSMTDATGYPTTVGAIRTTYAAPRSVVLSKISPDGSALLWSTYLGSIGLADSGDLAVTPLGEVYVAQTVMGADAPVSVGAYKTVPTGGVWLAHISKNGALTWGSWFGTGTHRDVRIGVSPVDATVVVATTPYNGAEEPTTAGAFQLTRSSVAQDVNVFRVKADGSGVLASTYLGGTADEYVQAGRVKVDAANEVYVTGFTESSNFPTTTGAVQTAFGGIRDVFVTKLRSTLASLAWSTYVGGNGYDTPATQGMDIDGDGNVYLSIATGSTNFPLKNALFTTPSSGVLARINANGTTFGFSTYTSYGNAYAMRVANGKMYTWGNLLEPEFKSACQPGGGGGRLGVHSLTTGGATDFLVNQLMGAGYAVDADPAGNVYTLTSVNSFGSYRSPGAFQTTVGGVDDLIVAKWNPAVSPTTMCITCTGNFATAGFNPCPTPDRPYCVTSGPLKGVCSDCSISKGVAPGSANDVACLNEDTPICVSAPADAPVSGARCQGCDGAFGSGTPAACPSSAAPTCAASGRCLACNGDFGSGTNGACVSAAAPACNTSGPLAGRCTVCSANNATSCGGNTGVCDPTNGTCLACNGDNGSAATRACPSTAKPICLASGACGECSATNTSACAATKPACDSATSACVACAADFGAAVAHACPSSTSPFCTSTGACGKCTDSGNGVSGCGNATPVHAGPICGVASGVCGTTCTKDAECAAGQYCNEGGSPAVCSAKISNGEALPPGTKCTLATGASACSSGACSSSDNACGRISGEACSFGADCRNSVCANGRCGIDEGATDGGLDAEVLGPDSAVSIDGSSNLDVDGGTAQVTTTTDPGCSCSEVGASNASPSAAAAFGLAMAFVSRRRKQRARA